MLRRAVRLAPVFRACENKQTEKHSGLPFARTDPGVRDWKLVGDGITARCGALIVGTALWLEGSAPLTAGGRGKMLEVSEKERALVGQTLDDFGSYGRAILRVETGGTAISLSGRPYPWHIS